MNTQRCVMQRPLFVAIALALLLVHCPESAGQPKPASKTSASSSKTLKAAVSATHVLDDYGVEVAGTKLPAKITAIRLGTPAADTGLRAGDVVLDFSSRRSLLLVTVKRGDKTYQAEVMAPTERDETEMYEGFYNAPKPQDQLRLSATRQDKGPFAVHASMTFCTIDDNPNFEWLHAEQKNPELAKQWAAWLRKMQTVVFRAVVANTVVPTDQKTVETRSDYHIAVRCETPNAYPSVEVTNHPNVPEVARREAAQMRLMPLLKSLGPHFGQFPPKTRAKFVHVHLIVVKPVPESLAAQ